MAPYMLRTNGIDRAIGPTNFRILVVFQIFFILPPVVFGLRCQDQLSQVIRRLHHLVCLARFTKR